MKKTILFFALILGMSGLAVAQTCGTGGGYSNYGNDYYYNSNTTSNFGSLGVINSRHRGFFDRSHVVDASLFKTAPGAVTIEYVLDNGDVLEVQAKKLRGQRPRGNQGFGNRVGNNGTRGRNGGPRPGNNYYYNSNQNFANGQFAIHCATINGRPLAVNGGTLTIDPGNGRRARTVLNMEVGRKGSFRGTVRVFK